MVQRFKFHSRFRKPGESVSVFVAELRRLAEHCQFEASLDDMLRDRLVVGIQDNRTQRRLLTEGDLAFQKAFQLAQSMELAAQHAESLHLGADQQSFAEGVSGEPRQDAESAVQAVRVQERRSCYRCGDSSECV